MLQNEKKEIIMTIIVGGVTRSGMTVTMQMLHMGGFPCFGNPPAFETYMIEKIPWGECEGRAVKLIDMHRHFPPNGDYRVILLKRSLREQAKSINKFLRMLQEPTLLKKTSLWHRFAEITKKSIIGRGSKMVC